MPMCWGEGRHSLLDPPGISVAQESMLTQLAFHQNMQGFFRPWATEDTEKSNQA